MSVPRMRRCPSQPCDVLTPRSCSFDLTVQIYENVPLVLEDMGRCGPLNLGLLNGHVKIAYFRNFHSAGRIASFALSNAVRMISHIIAYFHIIAQCRILLQNLT